jgi:Spy/CpxP family protein refolding chaperone
MKRTLLLVAVTIVGATGLSFAVSRWVVHHAAPRAVVNVHDAAWLKKELHLTDAQYIEVEKCDRAFQAQMNAYCAAHCAARYALGTELTQANPDATKARACIARMNKIQGEAEDATLTHILKIRALLNSQQARAYATIICDDVCNAPMMAQ